MTAREARAVEVIAEALPDARCDPDCWLTTSSGHPACSDCSATAALAALKAAGFVVATRDEIRAMTPSEQAELIGGEVEVHEWWDIFPRRRVVGQWREFEKAGERS